MVNEDKLSCCI